MQGSRAGVCHLLLIPTGGISGRNMWCYCQGKEGGAVWRMLSLFQVVLMFSFSLLLPPVSFPPSLRQALQEQAWAELPLCSHSSCQWRGWWSPGAGDPLFSCPQKWKPQTWVVFSLYLWDPFWGCCLHLFFALWKLAWLPGSVESDWLPGCLELISRSSHQCWLS